MQLCAFDTAVALLILETKESPAKILFVFLNVRTIVYKPLIAQARRSPHLRMERLVSVGPEIG
jgi:hypothetical protein